MVNLDKDIQYIKGVGPNRAKLLNKLGIFTLEDLITYFPREYEDRSKPSNIIDLVNGTEALIEAMPVARMSEIFIRRNLTLYKLIVRDATSTCQITWYNQPYLKNMFKVNEKYKFYGKVSNNYGKVDMQSPVFDTINSSKNTRKDYTNL